MMVVGLCRSRGNVKIRLSLHFQGRLNVTLTWMLSPQNIKSSNLLALSEDEALIFVHPHRSQDAFKVLYMDK
jgi:hypothetical protein